MQKTLEVILKQTQEQQNQQLRYFVRLPIENKVRVMALNRNIFHTLRQVNANTPLSLLSYSSLILSIKKFKDETNEVDTNASKLRAKSIRRRPQKEKLIEHWALVKTLKNDNNLSFRQIKEYLKKYHKIKISHSVIYETWKKYEVKNINTGEA